MNSFDCDDSIKWYEQRGMANDVVGTGSGNDSYYANTEYNF